MATGSSSSSIEVSNGPEQAFAQDLLDFANAHEDDQGYIEGDIVSFTGVKDKNGLTLVQAEAQALPDYDTRDEDIYGDLDGQFKLTIHADARKYKVDGSSGNNELLKSVKNWLLESDSKYKKILSQSVVRSEPEFHEVCTIILLDVYCAAECIGYIKDSPFKHDIWNKHMNKIIKEGICYAKGRVPSDLCKSLRQHIDKLAKNTKVDYHPKSNDIVRDLVHPALYPYVKGVSKLKEGAELPQNIKDSKDCWGRPYEESKFQWLPTPFKITNERKCLIQDYINNLDRNLFPELYEDLASLFEVFLPYFEEVWSYAKAMEFWGSSEDSDEPEVEESIAAFSKGKVCFNGQELQIITKIVDYKLKPEQSYEGVWHAEGMSHENIVMTGIYFLDRNSDLDGGDLRFKRAFSKAERAKVFWNIAQCRPIVVNECVAEGFIPLGYFPTEEDYLLVFPNCHIHKIGKLINKAKQKDASRRIVVFFFVNPEKRIVSTREVPPQQNSISLSIAKNYRLELMAERKYNKDKLNIRDIELCEH